jgi:hypothetical protein
MNETVNRIEDQVGPCGILCGVCPLGSGTVAESAGQTRKHIADCQIPIWAPFVPGGEAIDWKAMDRGLEWMQRYACCAGCQNGGGPPDCTIRICARERGKDLCGTCGDLDSCNRFEWLKEHGQEMKEKLKENRGLSKEEYLKKMQSSFKLPETQQ